MSIVSLNSLKPSTAFLSIRFVFSHVWMWELDYKESWALKNWCFWTVVLEKTLERPLDCKEIQPVHPKGDQSGKFVGRTDAEAETPILWPPDAKNWLIWKDPDTGKDWRREEKGTTEDEMVRWHHRLNGHNLSKFRELVMDREAWRAAVHGVGKSRTWLSDWTEMKHHKLGGIRWQKCIALQFWSLEIWNPGVSRATHIPLKPEMNPSLPLPASGSPAVSAVLWFTAAPPQPQPRVARRCLHSSSICAFLSLCPVFPSYKDTSYSGFWSTRYSHFNSIISAKTPCPNEGTFLGTG